MSAFRVGVGVVAILELLTRALDIHVFYTDYGLLPRAALVEEWASPFHISVHCLSGLYQVQYCIFFIHMLLNVMVISGKHTRLTALMSWCFFISLRLRNPMIIHEGDVILEFMLLMISCTNGHVSGINSFLMLFPILSQHIFHIALFIQGNAYTHWQSLQFNEGLAYPWLKHLGMFEWTVPCIYIVFPVLGFMSLILSRWYLAIVCFSLTPLLWLFALKLGTLPLTFSLGLLTLLPSRKRQTRPLETAIFVVILAIWLALPSYGTWTLERGITSTTVSLPLFPVFYPSIPVDDGWFVFPARYTTPSTLLQQGQGIGAGGETQGGDFDLWALVMGYHLSHWWDKPTDFHPSVRWYAYTRSLWRILQYPSPPLLTLNAMGTWFCHWFHTYRLTTQGEYEHCTTHPPIQHVTLFGYEPKSSQPSNTTTCAHVAIPSLESFDIHFLLEMTRHQSLSPHVYEDELESIFTWTHYCKDLPEKTYFIHGTKD